MRCVSDRGLAAFRVALVVLAASLAACTDADIVPVDASGDAGRGDAGADAGRQDAGREDAGPADGGGHDAGPVDAGGEDAGPVDAGGEDAGTVDPVTPDAEGQIVITEIMYDSDVVTDDLGEWFELHNPTDTAFDLDGCIISDEGNFDVVAGPFVVRPGAFVTAARFPSEAIGGFDPDYTYESTKLSNDPPPGGDTLTITCGSTDIDIVAYHDFDRAKGQSMSLDPAFYDAADNDSAASWCKGVDIYNMGAGEVDRGSPGVSNPDC